MVPGFDSVVVQLHPGLPVRERAGRLERELSLVALSLALRRARRVVLRLERLDDLPGGPAAVRPFFSGTARSDRCRRRRSASWFCGCGGQTGRVLGHRPCS